ncbi:MAG TPA: CPBP family intramembrane glutamic endopeptidase [Phycisphaerae bacterium]|nr:CPBP family intramembrane glutamic endopeptidase [Phycisphaerae bacterium]
MIVTGLIFTVGLIYVSVFWSRLPNLLPAPFDGYLFLHERLIGAWWRRHVHVSGPAYRSEYVFWAASNVVIGLVIPLAVLVLARRRWSDMGLGWPNRLGRRLTAAGIALSIPFGLWVLADNPQGIEEVWNDFRYIGLCGGIAMIPEHFLICGFLLALLLPERKLPEIVPLLPAEGGMIRRCLRWLGLAPSLSGVGRHAALAWFGLTPASLFAILASGVLFLVVHVGEPALELALAMPGGVAVAYMTLRSHSIWPGLLAHYALNLVPLGLWLLLR